jgi:uncharacterized membrane protein YhhN
MLHVSVDMQWPVRLYGIAICGMLLLALHMLYVKVPRMGVFLACGGLLFIASDSLLAIDKFNGHFKEAPALIMLTYAFAQLLIAEGASRYIRSVNTR